MLDGIWLMRTRYGFDWDHRGGMDLNDLLQNLLSEIVLAIVILYNIKSSTTKMKRVIRWYIQQGSMGVACCEYPYLQSEMNVHLPEDKCILHSCFEILRCFVVLLTCYGWLARSRLWSAAMALCWRLSRWQDLALLWASHRRDWSSSPHIIHISATEMPSHSHGIGRGEEQVS